MPEKAGKEAGRERVHFPARLGQPLLKPVGLRKIVVGHFFSGLVTGFASQSIQLVRDKPFGKSSDERPSQ